MLGLFKKNFPAEAPFKAPTPTDLPRLPGQGLSRRDLMRGAGGGLAGLLVVLSGLDKVFAEEPTPENETAEEKKMRLLYGVDKELQKKIDLAIDSGVKFILSRYDKREKGFPSLYPAGYSKGHVLSLIVYTLLSCGVDPDHRAIKDSLNSKQIKSLTDHNHVNYGRAVHVLCQAANIDAITKKYTNPATGKLRKGKGRISASKAAIKEQVKKITKTQDEHVFRYPNGLQGSPSGEDLSATQYVLLALQAAQRVGVKVPISVFEKALPYLIQNQEKDGAEVNLIYWNNSADSDRYGKTFKGKKVKARGWSYVAPDAAGEPEHHKKVTGSMTAAGVACVAIIKEALVLAGELNLRDPGHKEKLKPIDDSINSGWAKLGEIFTAKENPGGSGWHYYWLYGVERVGSFLGVPNMGEHKWYKEIAERLIADQRAPGVDLSKNPRAGSWNEKGPIWDDCFALLCLKRATKKPSVPVIPPTTTD